MSGEVSKREVDDVVLWAAPSLGREPLEDGVVLEHQPKLDGVRTGPFHERLRGRRMMADGDGAAVLCALLAVVVVFAITWFNASSATPTTNENVTVIVAPR